MKDPCIGKEALSKKDALSKANYYQKKTGDRMRAYACPYADHWHIGHRGRNRYDGDSSRFKKSFTARYSKFKHR